MERIVLAYSGGLDTSVAVSWLAETRGAEVVTLTLDLGQSRELDAIRERALAAGAVNAHVLDVRAEFASDYVLPALQAGAISEGGDPLATALSRPLMAKKLVEIARIEGARSIAHGCTGRGHDHVRIEVSSRAIDPSIGVMAPAREWSMSRSDEVDYARRRGIPVPATQTRPHKTDVNLWGRSIACDVLEDPWAEPPAEAFTLTADPSVCPDEPASLEIEFLRGTPVAVNGVPMPLLELIDSVTTIAGSHGVGRIDTVENRLIGIRLRDVYEAPAAVVLHAAHRELEGFVCPRGLARVKRGLALEYADLVDNGLWHSPLRSAIDAFVADVQQRVTGIVRLKLFKGSCRVVGRQSAFAPHECALAGGEGDVADHLAAAGLINTVVPTRTEP
ncbi:MAG: argininosuccinate synthase [Acidobacteriota bacterium]